VTNAALGAKTDVHARAALRLAQEGSSALTSAATMTTLVTKPFDALTPLELYRILQLRSAVFVVEQRCVFQDLDDHDFRAVHIFTEARRDDPLDGCVRVFPPGVTYGEASFGRLATASHARRTGLGRSLVVAALAWLDAHEYGPVQIGAQSYLERFYRGFGFAPVGEPYVEDGIPHMHMVRGVVP
jgi:ElaA protein